MSIKKLFVAVLAVVVLIAAAWIGGARYMKSSVNSQREAAVDAFAAADCTRAREAAFAVTKTIDLGRSLGFGEARDVTTWKYSWVNQSREQAHHVRNACDGLDWAGELLAEGKAEGALAQLMHMAYEARIALAQSDDPFQQAKLSRASAKATDTAMADVDAVSGLRCDAMDEYARSENTRSNEAASVLDQALQDHLPDIYLRCARTFLANKKPAHSLGMIGYLAATGSDGVLRAEARKVLREAVLADGGGCLALRDQDHPRMGNFYRALLDQKTGEWLPHVAGEVRDLHLKCAENYIAARKFKLAAAQYRAFLDAHPQDPRRGDIETALANLPVTEAEAALADGKLQEAEELFTALKESHGEDEIGKLATTRLAQIEIEKAKRLGAGELRPVPGVKYAETGPARLLLVNGTRYPLKVVYDGPNSGIEEIEACKDCDKAERPCSAETPQSIYELLPGKYQVLASATGTSAVRSYTGTFDLAPGHLYQQCLVIVSRDE